MPIEITKPEILEFRISGLFGITSDVGVVVGVDPGSIPV